MPEQERFPTVGIGASAGGIEALEGLFRGMPEDPGCAFVIVTHMDPDRPSMLPEIVARYTSLPVCVAEDGAALAPNSIYVAPSDALLDITDGKLRKRKASTARRERKPIDLFFSALARDPGAYASASSCPGATATEPWG